MYLLNGEEILMRSDTDELILTTYRVRFDSRPRGLKSQLAGPVLNSIMLENVCSCRIGYNKGYRWILILAVLFMFSGPFLFMTFILLLIYFLTQKKMLMISSANDTIKVKLVGNAFEEATGFIDRLEEARYFRLLSLQKHH